jgi:hypothetical protein
MNVSRRARVRTDFRVRRRRYRTASFLLFHNEWYEIDDVTDTVWQACEEGITVGEMVSRVAARHRVPMREAVAAVSYALGYFLELGFVELVECNGPAA